MSEPRFAVVGHPNKGKSSIVATLAADDRVRVAPEPGTTVRALEYPMRLDGRTLYTLIDTPGFQRARRALDWMRKHESTADRREAVVRQFIAAHGRGDTFMDEVELLRPIVDERHPAGILYVVDGSVPYGPEYEPEMEILRWTGRPSMALINPIGGDATSEHIESWRRALGQYFRIVRVFNAVTAEFDKRLELLRAFGQLDESWRHPLDEAVEALRSDRARRRREASREVASLLMDALTLTVTHKLGPGEDAKRHQPTLLEKFKGELRRRERRARERVEAVYEHHGLERLESDNEVEALEQDLFSEKAWMQFGLSRAKLAAAGALAGGVGVAWVDLALGGASLGAAAAAGAAVGGVLGWMGGGKLAEFQILTFQMGGTLLQCGPTRHANFPFVLFGRARLHHALVAGRTHAQRGALEVDEKHAGSLNPLTDAQRKELAAAFRSVTRAKGEVEAEAAAAAELREVIGPIFAGDERRGA